MKEPTLDETPKERKINSQLSKFESMFNNKYSAWVDQAEESNTFIRGSHFIRKSSGDESPEEFGGGDRMYPNVPYCASRLDKMLEYVRADEAQPTVEPEFDFNFPTEAEFSGTRELLGANIDPENPTENSEMSDNALLAKIYTARLDKYRDRSDSDRILDEVFVIGAQERVACIMVDYRPDDERKEPVYTTVARPGDFMFDPDAASIKESRFFKFTETSVSRLDVERLYDVKLRKDTEKNDNSSDRDNDTTSASGIVDVSHWWIKDYSLIDREDEYGESTQIPEYKNSWRKIVRVGTQIIYDGESNTPRGEPNVRLFSYRPMPRSMMGMSFLDLTKDGNKTLDRLQQYSIESAYKMQPKILVNKKMLKNPDQIYNNTPSGFVDLEVKDGHSMAEAVMYLAGGSPPTGAIEAFSRIRSVTDEFAGVEGVNIENAVNTEMSGKAIEGLMEGSGGGVSGRVRRNWVRFLNEYYTLVLETITMHEEETVYVTVPMPQGSVTVPIQVDQFRFEAYEFEPRFDVRVFSPSNMPRNPAMRAEYMKSNISTMIELSSVDPQLAMIWLKDADIPGRDALIQYLKGIMQPQQQGETAEAPAVSEAQGKIAIAEEEARLRVQSRTAETLADSYEEVAKQMARTDPVAAMQFIPTIPALIQQAMAPEPEQPVQMEQIPPELVV